MLCYVQWPVVQQSLGGARLPDCGSQQLPSRWDGDKTCTEADIFAREEHEVTCEFAVVEILGNMKSSSHSARGFYVRGIVSTNNAISDLFSKQR